MDRDRKANTRCTWFTQIGYFHGIEEFSLIVKGLHKYIGSSSPLVDEASSLEVLFLHPGVVSLTGGDAQGVPQVAELGNLLKDVTDKSIRPTEEFEGQNKSIKSRMRYLPWKHKMLKMSTREQCQYSLFAEVVSGGKKAEYFERLRWECPLRYEGGLSIFAGLPSTLKKWSVVSGKLMLCVKITDSFIQGDPALEVGKVLPLRFSNKQSYRGSDSRDSGNDASSIFEKAIMLGSTLPRSTEVDTQGLSNYPAVSDVVGAASFTCSTLAENFGKVICGTHELLLRVESADKAGKVGASSIFEIGPRGL
ncbi:hypothetical protein ACFX1R_003130 [Malus domestica]